jgi:hypothetical protein
MEVFLRNVPADLTEGGLRDQLEPVMGRLHIIDFLCEKPKRKQFGYITFMDPRDGHHFLAVHGQETVNGYPRARSRLQLIGSDIYCEPSKNPAKRFAVKTLHHASDQRGKTIHETQDEDSAISFEMHSFSCGYCAFAGEHLTYNTETQWSDPGIVKFKKRFIMVKTQNSTFLRIPLNSVIDLIWFENGTLTLTLTTVPFFFTSIGTGSAGGKRARLCFLSQEHAKVVGQCLVYQFKVSPVDLPSKIQQVKNWQMSVTHYNLRAGPGRGDFAWDHKSLMGFLEDCFKNGDIPFEILFQLQALADNAFLYPSTVLELATKLRRLFRENRMAGKKSISVDAMKKLFNQIPWPHPEENPENVKAGPVLELLKENEQEIREGFTYREGLVVPGRNLARINKVIVTPTRITLQGAEMEPNNRILRKFPNRHDCFIRAQFCDENGENMYFNPRITHDDVFARFKNIMKRGVQIAGRTYKFLGFSHSSLRNHSVWVSPVHIVWLRPLTLCFSSAVPSSMKMEISKHISRSSKPSATSLTYPRRPDARPELDRHSPKRPLLFPWMIMRFP